MKWKFPSAFFLFFLFCFLLSGIHHASAISISPGKIEMDFVPNYQDEFEGHVANTGPYVETYDLYADGELKDNIVLLTPDVVTVNPGQSQAFRFRLKLPAEFEKPGKHKGYVFASQHVDEEQQTQVVVRLKVGLTVLVNVPYPGKYVETEFSIDNAEVGEDIIFTISAKNMGKENLTEVWAEIELFDEKNDTIAILQTEREAIETTETEDLKAAWPADVDPGVYRANVTVFYDGETLEFEKGFSIGAPVIRIAHVYPEPVTEGSIGKVFTELRNYWNQKIEDVYVEIFIMDDAGKNVSSHKSENSEIDKFSLLNITNYIDTGDEMEPGVYEGLAVLHYPDGSDGMDFSLRVVEEEVYPFGSGLLILVAVILILAAVPVVVFVYRRKKKEPKQLRLG